MGSFYLSPSSLSVEACTSEALVTFHYALNLTCICISRLTLYALDSQNMGYNWPIMR